MNRLFYSLAFTAAALAMTDAARAQVFPVKPIRAIVPQPAGGGSDAVVRIWADCAAKTLGQAVIVENKPGANGVPALRYLKSQPADGYTVFFTGMSQMAITPYIYTEAPYDPLKDFDGVALVMQSPLLLVTGQNSGIEKFPDMVSQARMNPEGMSIASPGNGSPGHLLGAAMSDRLNVKLVHIPFQGEAAPLTQVMGGTVPLLPVTIGTALPQLKSGRIKALAIFSDKRAVQLPDVPTIGEAMGASELGHAPWGALIARAGTPPAAIQALNEATQKCLADPLLIEKFAASNITPVPGPASAVREYIQRDTNLWRPLVRRLGIKND